MLLWAIRHRGMASVSGTIKDIFFKKICQEIYLAFQVYVLGPYVVAVLDSCNGGGSGRKAANTRERRSGGREKGRRKKIRKQEKKERPKKNFKKGKKAWLGPQWAFQTQWWAANELCTLDDPVGYGEAYHAHVTSHVQGFNKCRHVVCNKFLILV